MELTVILGLLLDQWIELGLVEGPCRGHEIQVRPFYQDEVIWVAAPFDPLAKVNNPLFHNYISFLLLLIRFRTKWPRPIEALTLRVICS